MEIAVEISLYPLDTRFVPPIQEFIDRLNARHGLAVVTNSMSTQISGDYDDVMRALAEDVRPTLERAAVEGGKRVFVMKLLGPL